MKISKTTFEDEEVILDFHEYEGCKFNKCRFVVLGYGAFILTDCEMTDCSFSLAGPAFSTIQTLSTIYHNMGDQGKALIEGTFESIRNSGANKPE